ncbi:hypothetical protein D3C78_1027680 [compost metagenome]
MARAAPLAQALLLDEARIGLVERGVARQVQALVGQLVEDQPGQPLVAPGQHAAQQRVVEPAEGGVGRHPGHLGVQPLDPQQRGGAAGALLVEVAAVGHAAGNREAVGQRLQGELGGGEQVPHHVGALEVGVQAVAAVVRQGQLAAGEVAGFLGALQALAQLGGLRWIGEQLGDRLAGLQQLPLAAGQLRVVAETGAAAEEDEQGEQAQHRHGGPRESRFPAR